MKIAVLGCGPAGLLVAHAARMTGNIVIIFSKRQRSPMRGAQYQHVEIPGIPGNQPELLKYTLVGTVDDYREKVYAARNPDIIVSPAEYEGVHKCWDLRHAYDWLWHQFGNNVVNVEVTHTLLSQLTDSFDLVISTVPAPVLCEQEHQFNCINVWIDSCWMGPTTDEDPGLWRGIQHLVICNGLPMDSHRPERTGWYRSSNIFQAANTEWSSLESIPKRRNKPGLLFKVRKPISTDCVCWPSIVRAGRYGAWRKGVLTHHAFQEAMAILE